MSRSRAQRARRCLAVAVSTTLLAVLIAAPAAGTSARTLRVSEGGGPGFPARALVLSVNGARGLVPTQLHISENRKPVQGAIVTPLSSAGAGDFGVVLAIDVSPSMRGAPLERAMAAARALASQRRGNQQLAVVTFDRSANVALPLTADPRAIARALAHTPRTGRGAYLYNALTLAVQQLARANIAAGAVILLSDGASEGADPRLGNHVTATAVGAAAAAAHAQIYTVGLRDSSYTPQRMSLLARVGGGAFIESTSSQLAQTFTRIEAGLTSAYVVHYRSLAPLGRRISVSVRVDGVPQEASLTYRSPPSPRPLGAKPPKGTSFWVSSLALVLCSCAAALLVGLGAFVLLARRLRRGGLRRRVGEFTASGAVAGEVLPASASSPLPALERLLERTSWWPRFKTAVEIGRIPRSAIELVTLTAVCTIGVALLLGFATGTPVPSLLALPLGPAALHSFVRWRMRKQRELFTDQLPAHLQELASMMRVGHSLVAAITSIAEAAPEPSGSEWARVAADERLGVPLDEAMQPLARRMDSDDIAQVALVASLHQRTGGNMAEVLERVAESVRERSELRRELRALTAQARLSRHLVTSLPLLVLGVVWLINRNYVKPLFDTTAGVILLCVAGGLLFGASQIMRAITEIKV